MSEQPTPLTAFEPGSPEAEMQVKALITPGYYPFCTPESAREMRQIERAEYMANLLEETERAQYELEDQVWICTHGGTGSDD